MNHRQQCLCCPCLLYYKLEIKSSKSEIKTHEELLKQYSARKSLHVRTYLDHTKMLCSFTGTVLAACIMEWQLWSTLTIFWVVRLIKFPSNPLPGLLSSALSITSSLWIFCIIFYISECFVRFTKHQKSACESSEHVFDCCILARKNLSKEGSLSFVRLLNAAHLLAYVGLGGEYNEQNFLIPFLKKYFLLTEEELARIKEIGLDSGHSFREVIVWLFQIVKAECGTHSLSKTQQKLISGKLLSFGDSLSRFYAFKELPMPFSYVHCINFNLFLLLPMYSFTLAYSYSKFDKDGESLHFQTVLGDSLIESFYLFVYTLIMLSLKTLGRRFAEPLGHDSEDLNIFHFVEATIAGTTSIMREFSRPLRFSPEESLGNDFPLSKRQTKQKKFQNETLSTGRLNAQMIMLCEEEYSEEKMSLITETPMDEYSEKNESLMTKTPEKEDSKRRASFAPVYARNTWFTQSSQIYPEEQLKV